MPKRQSKRKRRVSILGSGRLGTALALGLASRGYAIEAVVTRRLSHARRAARLVEGGCLALTEAQLDSLPASELILIATPDDVIASVAIKLAGSRALTKSNRTVLHTSGALSSEILQPLKKIGFQTGSFHPLISVSEPRAGAAALGEAFYCLEGQPSAIRVARRIVRDLGGRSFSIESRHKALYHAAAVMSSGHVTAVFDIAIEMLKHCGLPESNARRVLLPLLESTWKNLVTSDPANALTGTFARGDEATVAKHLAAIVSARLGDALAAYRLLGERSLKLAEEKGADPAVIKRIDKMLRSNLTVPAKARRKAAK